MSTQVEEIDMEDNTVTMKTKFLETIGKLNEEGVDLGETPALFQWTYPEEPKVLIQVMFSESENEVILQ